MQRSSAKLTSLPLEANVLKVSSEELSLDDIEELELLSSEAITIFYNFSCFVKIMKRYLLCFDCVYSVYYCTTTTSKSVLLCRTLCPVTKCDIKYVDVQVVCQYYYAVLCVLSQSET